MNITTISNQIEIAFWMGIVTLIRDRRISRVIMLALIALLSLVALLLTAFSWAYIRLPARSHVSRPEAIQTTAFLGHPENGQKNLLLILVDDLKDNEPNFEGAWMLITASSGLRVTFMPIFMAGAEGEVSAEAVFRLEKDGGLPAAIQRAVQAKDLWWDNYLLVDRTTLQAMVDLAGGIDLGEGRAGGQQVIDLMPIAHQNVHTAYELQARIARGICQRFDIALQNATPRALVEILTGGGLSKPASSDLTLDQLAASWSRMQKAGGLVCEFPTLIGR